MEEYWRLWIMSKKLHVYSRHYFDNYTAYVQITRYSNYYDRTIKDTIETKLDWDTIEDMSVYPIRVEEEELENLFGECEEEKEILASIQDLDEDAELYMEIY